MSESTNKMEDSLIAWYPFDDEENVGKDISGAGYTAKPMGSKKPLIKKVRGRKAVRLQGGSYGVSYLELPTGILKDVSDDGGFSVSAWICCEKPVNVWERIFDFGKGDDGPYLFFTRFMRGVCFDGTDLFADAALALPIHEWVHVAMTVTGTKGGSLSSAGPRVYMNGELIADGFISQTSSGNYKKLREWFETLKDDSNYPHNYIGHSQFLADADFCGSIADFRMYHDVLSEEDIISLMCESLSERDILYLARDKFLPSPAKIITEDLRLPKSLIDGRVQVEWICDRAELITQSGKVSPLDAPASVCIQAKLTCGASSAEKDFYATIVPKHIAPYELTVYGEEEVVNISDTLFGLFYEDINNAADGGIYAEMIQNRSFEEFTYKVYDTRSGENGISSGRKHFPLRFWFGDFEKMTPKCVGGLNEHFGITEPEVNTYYIEVQSGTRLSNRGFCDKNLEYSMNIKSGKGYQFTIWAKSEAGSRISVALADRTGSAVSNTVVIEVDASGEWKKYTADRLLAEQTVMGQVCLVFEGDTAIDMVSLMPEEVWGAEEEALSKTAHANYSSNSNYRLRRDLVEMLAELHPRFLRFPGGCISEGSYIWDNVYNWKDSVGEVEVRKEGFNVWGYVMTLGLGYMEYFQLAEDLNAEPLPVMACGVLCQARSDYVNPAGGKLQEKYIKNFTDLIDFAISTDFEGNEWAALRKKMGHEAPFGLHYLGVGNENWGPEFFASFEAFKYAIDCHMEKYYPGYELHIISTVGAQADDDAYQQCWKFLAGYMEGGAKVSFTDGEKSFTERVNWYPHEKNYLSTIVDEHYYRSNEYLLENVDRYNYYYRPYQDGKPVEDQVSKVFVGEYASSDKNTLAGAVAEAAVMTGFERNSDVVRLAATAPLFNKVVSDGTYRWTPDVIWFDNESAWRTPNYYVQQMFAKYIGTKLLLTGYATYEAGQKKRLEPCGGVRIAVSEGEAVFKKLTVTSNQTGEVLFAQDFAQPLDKKLLPFCVDAQNTTVQADGIKITATADRCGYYLNQPEWKDYTVQLIVEKMTERTELFMGAGLQNVTAEGIDADNLNLLEYCVGYGKYGTGLKVFKDGKEGYTMGDYSSSVFAGNLRSCYDEAVPTGEYTITINYGGEDGKHILCCYAGEDGAQKGMLDCKLKIYNRDVFHSVTKDEEKIYIKLVNPGDFEKKLKLSLKDISVKAQAELVVLTGAAELAHVPNVNTKEEEKIVPKIKQIEVAADGLELLLPANSLNVVVLDIK